MELDRLNGPSSIVMGQSFTDDDFQDFRSAVTQALFAALGPEPGAVLNGLKSVEDALNDGAARLQAILDRAGSPFQQDSRFFWGSTFWNLPVCVVL